MKKLVTISILVFTLLAFSSKQESFKLRGMCVDDDGNILYGVKIELFTRDGNGTLKKTDTVVYSGFDGKYCIGTKRRSGKLYFKYLNHLSTPIFFNIDSTKNINPRVKLYKL